MLLTNSEHGRRLIKRMLILIVIAVFSYLLHLFNEKYEGVILILIEMAIWPLWLFLEMRDSFSGGLKSRPDPEYISVAALFEIDPEARLYVGVYMIILALVVVFGESLLGFAIKISMTPGSIFVLIAPIAVFIFFRVYRLESQRDAT